YRRAILPLVGRLCALARTYEDSARVGARRLPFRARWAVLAAAGIYGGIACKVRAGGIHAWDRRATTSTAAKLGFVFKGLWQAAFHSGRDAPGARPSRRDLAALARENAAR